MKIDAAKKKFIETWIRFGSAWGINRTMAQIHAYLLVNPEPKNTDELMKVLKISRGNVNMNVRALMDWGLVSKSLKTGERKEYFSADRDVWQAARKIIQYRRMQELEPLLGHLKPLREVEGDAPEVIEFQQQMKSLYKMTNRANKALSRLEKIPDEGIVSTLSKMLK